MGFHPRLLSEPDYGSAHQAYCAFIVLSWAGAHSLLQEVTELSDRYFDLNMFIGFFSFDVGGSKTFQGSVKTAINQKREI